MNLNHKMPQAEFIRTWNDSPTLYEAIAKMPYTKHAASVRASALRSRGFPLKLFKVVLARDNQRTPTDTKSHRAMKISTDLFCKIWNDSDSLKEIEARTGYSKSCASTKACILRGEGFTLKHFTPNCNGSEAISTQVGGTHYKDMAIQPAEFCQKNRLGYLESLTVKYVARHGKKGKREDIEKAIHCLQMLMEMEYQK